MYKQILVLLIIVPIVFSGCSKLGTVDLSGEYYLYRQNDYKTESFVNIDSYTWGDSGYVDYLLDNVFYSNLGDSVLDRYWREKWNGLELVDYHVNIGETSYLVGADFYQTHIDLEIRDAKGDIIPGLQQISSTYSSPFEGFDLDDLSWTERTISQKGKDTYSFIEPNSSKDFCIDGSYQAALKISRDIFTDPETGEREKRRERYEVDFTADLSIAFAQYLKGEEILINDKGKKIQLRLYVFDRNLDGEFNHDDYLLLEYPSTLFFHEQIIIPFGKPVPISKKSQTLYSFHLAAPKSAPVDENPSLAVDNKNNTGIEGEIPWSQGETPYLLTVELVNEQ